VKKIVKVLKIPCQHIGMMTGAKDKPSMITLLPQTIDRVSFTKNHNP
jgi:hypothetical protein